jgi:hypothetical protein
MVSLSLRISSSERRPDFSGRLGIAVVVWL